MHTPIRWSAIGVAVLVVVGAGVALPSASATNTDGGGTGTVFVPIVPCRLFDTRADQHVGPRTSPLGAADTYTQQVTGTNGNCTIPTAATAVALNVTVDRMTSNSYLTLWPADAPRPLASNLNWAVGAAPTPNKVDVKLSADGKVSFYNNAGQTDVLADVVGYYAGHDHDDRYYTKAEIDATIHADTYPALSLKPTEGGTIQGVGGCEQESTPGDVLVVPLVVPVGAHLLSVDVGVLDTFGTIPWTIELFRYTVSGNGSTGVVVATATGPGTGTDVVVRPHLTPVDEVVAADESFLLTFGGFASNGFCNAVVSYTLAGP